MMAFLRAMVDLFAIARSPRFETEMEAQLQLAEGTAKFENIF